MSLVESAEDEQQGRLIHRAEALWYSYLDVNESKTAMGGAHRVFCRPRVLFGAADQVGVLMSA